MGVSQILTKVCILATTVIWARALGVSDFGVLLGIQAITIIAAYFWDAGLSPMATRELAANHARLDQLFFSLWRLRIRLLPIPILVFVVGATAMHRGWSILPIAVIGCMSALLAGGSLLLNADLVANLEFRQAAFPAILARLSTLGMSAAIAIARVPSPFLWMASSVLLGELVSFAMLLNIVGRKLLPSWGRESQSLMDPKRALKVAVPYAMSVFFGYAYARLDVIFVVALAGAREGGYYAPASRLQDALMMIPAIAVAGLLPLVAREAESSLAVRRALRVSQRIGLLLAIPATAIVVIWAPELIRTVLGSRFGPTVEPARLMALTIPFAVLEIPLLAVIIGKGNASKATAIYGAAFVASAVGHVILDPRMGAVGGAWASFARYPLTLIISFAVYQAQVSRERRVT